jgi:signal transduction histidine kinase
MVPYRGRLALRISRIILAAACLAWYVRVADERFTSLLAVLAAYLVYAIGVLFELRLDSPARGRIALIADTAFFALWSWMVASGYVAWPASGWLSAMLCAYLLCSAVLLHDVVRVISVAGAVGALAVVFAPRGEMQLVWVAAAVGAVSIGFTFQKRYVERRLSNTLRHNVIIRSQAQGAREAERQRIAADFHDGPLQSFISFQMRLEIVKKLMARDMAAAADELRQLQDLCRSQLGELRSFVRSMRPADDGVSLPASLSRMLEQFQRETGIISTFAGGNLHDPAEIEVSLELLQIVRETLNNIQKHSGATRLAVSIGMTDHRIEIRAEDNGSGFPFSGTFSLEEMELLRLGPVSIKRRVKMLGGDMQLDSRPGQGASLQIRIPV